LCHVAAVANIGLEVQSMDTIRLFHGTTKRFSEFATKGVTPRFDTGAYILGHYLTESESHVMAYARGRWGKVYIVDASFEAMKTVPPRPSGISEIDRMQLDFTEEDFAEYRNDLVAQGYDSVCFETVDGFNEYVFLHADQLRIVECVPAEEFKGIEQPALAL
jgi:hypothetical protein